MNCRHIKLYLVYMHSFFLLSLSKIRKPCDQLSTLKVTVCSQVSAPSEFLSLRNAVKASFLILICLLF